MKVVFFVLNNIDILTHCTFSSIAIELKNDGQRALNDQEFDGLSWREAYVHVYRFKMHSLSVTTNKFATF